MVQTYQASSQKLYYPKRTPQQTLGLVLVVLGAILLFAYGLGLIFLIPGILLWYYGQEKCPSCKARGKLRSGRTDLVNQQRGFGIVTRTDVVSGKVGNRRQRSTVQRQERVPVVGTTTRVFYQCSACQRFVGSRDYYTEQEDFSPPQQQTIVQREFQREVTERVLITCAHCGNRSPQGTPRCPNCGANL
ncbi:MAG TPA: hypothetical protein VNW25_04020 [Candidatus Sulfotelmatobacter sp.]|jgi:hypothetical protein|nr:hypothetical protein [Candidatus Sulfotelmatobacter sp.]